LAQVASADSACSHQTKQEIELPPMMTMLSGSTDNFRLTDSLLAISAEESLLTISCFALHSSVLPPIADALPFAESIRRALIRNRVDTNHSEAITGKTINGVPLEGHEHAHYFATDEDGDRRLDHVTIYCPRGFDEADVEALGSLRTIYRRGNRADVRMILIGFGGVQMFAQREGLRGVSEPRAVATGFATGNHREASLAPSSTINTVPNAHDFIEQSAEGDVRGPSGTFAKSKRWRSVTPFSLPRFPNRGGGKPPRPRDLPEAQLIRELRLRGFPEPVSIKRIEGYQPNGRPMVRWLEFHTVRFKGTQGKGLAGFEIEFAEPVNGPIAVGFGCHFGLGLFAPC
jgi:CRISPR-associated protein Csb2